MLDPTPEKSPRTHHSNAPKGGLGGLDVLVPLFGTVGYEPLE